MQKGESARYHLRLVSYPLTPATGSPTDAILHAMTGHAPYRHRTLINAPENLHRIQQSGSEATFHRHCSKRSRSRWTTLSAEAFDVLLFLITFFRYGIIINTFLGIVKNYPFFVSWTNFFPASCSCVRFFSLRFEAMNLPIAAWSISIPPLCFGTFSIILPSVKSHPSKGEYE